jgi:threonine aldolase
MRRAMAEAEVGDDVHADDPTVRTLEEETAGLLGMEAALFVPSGSMGNGIAVAVHTKPGDTIVLDPHAHLVTVESRAVVDLLGRRFHTVEGDRGRLEAGRVGASLDAGGVRPALFEAENTFNWHNGALYEPEALRALGEEARSRRARFHLDGARLWNASVATGLPLAAYAACADSVMVCYSKGLGAPIGSALAGSAAFVEEARVARRTFGGAMRQVGIVAAGALYAVRHHRGRLADDHRRARRLAEAVAEIDPFEIDPGHVESNIVIARAGRAPERLPAFVEAAERHGARVLAFGGPGSFRAVTHLDVDDTGIERAVLAFRAAAAEVWGAPA